jgi:hypothetical protein
LQKYLPKIFFTSLEDAALLTKNNAFSIKEVAFRIPSTEFHSIQAQTDDLLKPN